MINKEVLCLLLNQLEMVSNEIEDKILCQERLIRQIEEYAYKNLTSPNETAFDFIRRNNK